MWECTFPIKICTGGVADSSPCLLLFDGNRPVRPVTKTPSGDRPLFPRGNRGSAFVRWSSIRSSPAAPRPDRPASRTVRTVVLLNTASCEKRVGVLRRQLDKPIGGPPRVSGGHRIGDRRGPKLAAFESGASTDVERACAWRIAKSLAFLRFRKLVTTVAATPSPSPTAGDSHPVRRPGSLSRWPRPSSSTRSFLQPHFGFPLRPQLGEPLQPSR